MQKATIMLLYDMTA